jgi:hypothetical protein|tara:strand:+ start:968 stop:1117 length:150 start_codon:yes stop_codon:yes gene_type:complete
MITPVNSELKVVASEEIEKTVASDLNSEQTAPLEEIIENNAKDEEETST